LTIGIWGAGLIGRALAGELAKKNVPVCVLNRSIDQPVRIGDAELPMRRLCFAASEEEMATALQGLSVLVHCAGSVSDDYAEFEMAAVRMANAAIKARLSRVLMLSTVAVYGQALEEYGLKAGLLVGTDLLPAPATKYAQSRYRAEISMRQIFESAGVDFSVIRIPMVLGPGMTAMPFTKLRNVLDIGIFPLFGSPTASLPCIRSDRLAQSLTTLVTVPEPLLPLYQFAQCLPWVEVVDSYEAKTARRVRSFPLPGRSILGLLELLEAHRAAIMVQSLMNEAVYLDDAGWLIASSNEGAQPSIATLDVDSSLREVLWPELSGL
jgi:nucleoside-diphosphate-sugar epimerase